MKPQLKLGDALTPDGGKLSLYSHDGRFSIRLNGQELMHSATSMSESQLGELSVARISPKSKSRILVGGLGLGFTLHAVLAKLGHAATVDVVELCSDVVLWNRTHLLGLNGWRLDDRRVIVRHEDVGLLIARSPAASFDAIALDVDNGPAAMVHRENSRLYDEKGLKAIFSTLRLGGRLAVWSAAPDKKFEQRLTRVGFMVKRAPAKIHETAHRSASTLYLADKAE